MKQRSKISVIILTTALLFILSGCMTFRSDVKSGSVLDEQKISLIQTGKTTFSEIIDWFGPPDNIIDGTQEMVDIEAMIASGGVKSGFIPTRTLTAPKDKVILIYKYHSQESDSKAAALISHTNLKINDDELFIYLSKKDRLVEEVIVGAALNKGY